MQLSLPPSSMLVYPGPLLKVFTEVKQWYVAAIPNSLNVWLSLDSYRDLSSHISRNSSYHSCVHLCMQNLCRPSGDEFLFIVLELSVWDNKDTLCTSIVTLWTYQLMIRYMPVGSNFEQNSEGKQKRQILILHLQPDGLGSGCTHSEQGHRRMHTWLFQSVRVETGRW